MMVKPAIAALLALLCLLLIKANIDTFQTAAQRQETEITPAPKGPAKKISPQRPVTLNPSLSSELADLNSGYLFNAARFLAREDALTDTATDADQNIRMEDIVFTGAILGEGYAKALVSYDLAPTQNGRPPRPGPQMPAAGRSKTMQLSVGDEIGGYTVKEISPDFILFVKGSDTFKKTLFETDKKRHQVTPRPTPPPSSPRTSPGVAPLRQITPMPAERP